MMHTTDHIRRMLIKAARVSLLLALLGYWGCLQAQQWDELAPAEQDLLLPWAEQWQDMSDDDRVQMLQGLRQWQAMTLDERMLARQRFTQWQGLSAEQRQRLRLRFQRFRALPPEQQARVRAGMQRLRALSPEQRQGLRQRWQQMSPDQRRAFRDGARLGVLSERRRWMFQLDADQRQALRTMVDGFSVSQRQQLRQRMLMLDDEGRLTLVKSLLAAAPAERASMLQAEVE